MYYRARWYDPQVGRFVSEDPIGFKGGMNLYLYVGDSPLNYIPFGLWLSVYYYRTGGRDGGGRIVAYDMDRPRQLEWVQNNSNDINQPVGDYQLQDNKVFELDEGLFSGVGDCKNNIPCEETPSRGPIPGGDFVILPDSKGRGWYSLYRQQSDGAFRDFGPVGNGTIRGAFRLHPGTLSLGCLTIHATNRESYNRLSNLLKNTSTIQVNTGGRNPQRAYGYLKVY
jgi:hypothetical protein